MRSADARRSGRTRRMHDHGPLTWLSLFPLLAVVVLGFLSGCATYRPLALPYHTALISPGDALLHFTNSLETACGTCTINPSDGFDITEVAILAVLNNPDLKARRAEKEVAAAQVFSAGLLPDPQLSANLDAPTGAGAGFVTGWGVGVDYDLMSLITRHRRLEAERYGAARVDLEVLWDEWQVIQQARTLCTRDLSETRQLEILASMKKLYQERYTRSTEALAQKNVTLEINGTDLTALLDVQSQIVQLEQAHNETRHELNYLLGLAPGAVLNLKAPPAMAFPSAATVKEQLAALPGKRPDLLALEAGYQAQEEHLRAAILAQFPSLSVGVNRARGTDGLLTSGFGVSLNLPFFSRNRGQIAMERATRAQLREEYQARLARAATDADRLVELHRIVEGELDNLCRRLPQLTKLMEHTSTAYAQGDIEALTFLNIESTWLNKRLEKLQVEQVRTETIIALQTLLALPTGTDAPATLNPDMREIKNEQGDEDAL